MAITLHTGYPGSGKSYAGVSEVIAPGVKDGRRVVTNVEGVNPEKVMEWAQARRDPGGPVLGEVVVFQGTDATRPGFWPTEDNPEGAFVKPGDLVVFDEWRLYFNKRGPIVPAELEPFLRYHRHLVDQTTGHCVDLHVLTQAYTDFHQDLRGLVEKSFKYKKLRSLGLDRGFSWQSWQGGSQPKGEAYLGGTGTYKPEFFDLYQSYKGEKGLEAKTTSRDSIWSGWKAKATVAAIPALGIAGAVGLWWSWSAMMPQPAEAAPVAFAPGQSAPQLGQAAAAAPVSPWRIVGQIDGDGGVRVIVANDAGSVRMMLPDTFQFDAGRPVSGLVDGRVTVAEDRLPSAASSPMLPGVGL